MRKWLVVLLFVVGCGGSTGDPSGSNGGSGGGGGGGGGSQSPWQGSYFGTYESSENGGPGSSGTMNGTISSSGVVSFAMLSENGQGWSIIGDISDAGNLTGIARGEQITQSDVNMNGSDVTMWMRADTPLDVIIFIVFATRF